MMRDHRHEQGSIGPQPSTHLIEYDTVGKAGARYASAKQTRRHGDHEPAAGRPAGARVRGDAAVRGGRVGTGRGPHVGQTQQAMRRSGGRR